jgi:ACT domain-containing protein
MGFLDSCKIEYNNSKQLFNNKSASLFFTYFGEFNSLKISEITSQSEDYLKKIGAVKKSIKITFNVLIEGLQNIINHGDRSPDGNQIAYFNFGEKGSQYAMTFSNLINIDSISNIKKAIDRLNKSDQASVKEIYINTLTNGEISKKGGAGLGIITMAMKSKNKIEYDFKSVNAELSIITIEIKINKN